MWLASAVVPVHSVSEHPPPALLLPAPAPAVLQLPGAGIMNPQPSPGPGVCAPNPFVCHSLLWVPGVLLYPSNTNLCSPVLPHPGVVISLSDPEI